jgi:hypothetical protein
MVGKHIRLLGSVSYITFPLRYSNSWRILSDDGGYKVTRYLMFLMFVLPTGASTFTATTTSSYGPNAGAEQCADAGPLGASCGTSSYSDSTNNSGYATASAGFEPATPGYFGAMASAEVDLLAVCGPYPCLTQSGTADAELDLAIHGGAAGTPGLVEITSFISGFGGLTSVGLTTGYLLGPHGGLVYSFTYDQPFHLSASVDQSCSECGLYSYPVRATAYFQAPFYVYDTSMNLVSTINSPLDAQPAPEPGTLTIMIVGLALIARAVRPKTHAK